MSKIIKKAQAEIPSWMGESINEEEITGYIEPQAKEHRSIEKSTRKFYESFSNTFTILIMAQTEVNQRKKY